jgi:uncharacterized protein (DUF302 family)
MTSLRQVQRIVRPYGFGATVRLSYADTIERTRACLKEQGFGVLTEIDVRKTMEEKLNAEFRPYVILGACNPPLAHRALSADLGIGLLLPCNVIVYDNGDGTSSVEAMDPQAALSLVGGNPTIAEVANEAAERLRRAIDALTTPNSSPAGIQMRSGHSPESMTSEQG